MNTSTELQHIARLTVEDASIASDELRHGIVEAARRAQETLEEFLPLTHTRGFGAGFAAMLREVEYEDG